MRVIVYVEGPSDKAALKSLLRPLLDRKWEQGVRIEFFETSAGNRKASLLGKAPKKAVNIILNDPHSVVVALPDLYPTNVLFRHSTVQELICGVSKRFDAALEDKGAVPDLRLTKRFRVFCLKYDLEALVLAAEEELAGHLADPGLKTQWRKPVEDQDDKDPPRRIVEQVFAKYGRAYHPVIDAPVILGSADYVKIAERCPQCFKLFVDFLEQCLPSMFS